MTPNLKTLIVLTAHRKRIALLTVLCFITLC